MINRSFLFALIWGRGQGLQRKRFLIIHNRMAGRLKAPMLRAVLKQLERLGAEVDLQAAASVEEDIKLASSAAQAGKVDAVIAAGGDSTIRGVALGLRDQAMPLGIIPAGTGNVLAQEIALGKKPHRIAQTLIEGETKTIRMGVANGEPFLLMAGAGFDAQIVRDLDHDLKQRIRKAAYVGPTLRALMAVSPRFSVQFVDDPASPESYSAAFVVVTRARFYGGSFVIAPDADLASDELQVVMFMNEGRFAMVRSLIGMATGGNGRLKKQVVASDGRLVGKIMHTPGVMIRSAKSVRIECETPFATQIDGDYLETVSTDRTGGFDIRSDGGRVELIVPTKTT